jgi:hypothetical protein
VTDLHERKPSCRRYPQRSVPKMQYYESDNDDDEVEGEDFSFRKLTVLSRMLMTAVNA